MPHCEPEALSLFALGEPVGPDDAEHLALCPLCRDEVDSLTAVVGLARDPHDPHDPTTSVSVPPPAAVWERIAAETGVTARPRVGVPGPADEPAPARLVSVPTLSPVSARPSTPTPDGAGGRMPVPLAPTRPRKRRFGTRSLLLAAAAGVGLGALGGAGVVAAITDGRSTPPVAAPPTTVVVTVRLDPLGQGRQARGSAEVVRDAGARELVVDVADLRQATGFLEVWLIDSKVKRMVPVGVLHDGRGRFTLPDGIDLAQYPIVDISVEPLDGDPLHSGDSVLRGVISS